MIWFWFTVYITKPRISNLVPFVLKKTEVIDSTDLGRAVYFFKRCSKLKLQKIKSERENVSKHHKHAIGSQHPSVWMGLGLLLQWVIFRVMTGINGNLKQPFLHLQQLSWGLGVLKLCQLHCRGLKVLFEIDSFGVFLPPPLSPGPLSSAFSAASWPLLASCIDAFPRTQQHKVYAEKK